ncbi:MAG: M28 family peptidase, partial [Anaerolineales bacterium]|nr:M28 family peptidase [Anaerolineales bacterium]
MTHPRMLGRALGSDGMHLAAFYNAIEFEKIGVQPGGSGRAYFQERERAFEKLNDSPKLEILDAGPTPAYRQDYAAYPGRNVTAGQASGPVRFISLGADAVVQSPGWHTYYPDLGRADYSGEILLTLSDREASYLTVSRKAGLLIVTENPDLLLKRFTLSGRTGMGLDLDTGERFGTEQPYMWISEELANRILAPDGYTVDQLRVMSEEHSQEQIFDIPLQTKVAMDIDGTLVEDWPIFNVLGLIPGTEGFDLCEVCLGKQLIVVLVPYDSPPVGPEGIYQHAIDNASSNAIMLEAMRILQETDYQPLKSFLFIAYSGEGLEGGNSVAEPDINQFLQASPSFRNFKLEAIVQLRGLGGGTGDRLVISAEGSVRLAKVAEKA